MEKIYIEIPGTTLFF